MTDMEQGLPRGTSISTTSGVRSGAAFVASADVANRKAFVHARGDVAAKRALLCSTSGRVAGAGTVAKSGSSRIVICTFTGLFLDHPPYLR
jgi:hypothetical protein